MGFCWGFWAFRMSLVLPGSDPDVFGQAQNHHGIMAFPGIIHPPSDLGNGWSWGGHGVRRGSVTDGVGMPILGFAREGVINPMGQLMSKECDNHPPSKDDQKDDQDACVFLGGLVHGCDALVVISPRCRMPCPNCQRWCGAWQVCHGGWQRFRSGDASGAREAEPCRSWFPC